MRGRRSGYGIFVDQSYLKLIKTIFLDNEIALYSGQLKY